MLASLVVIQMQAVTMSELLLDRKLTPKRFANHFEYFRYEFHDEVQPAEIFLSMERGDCDDYAILADFILKPKGYATRLIHVRLAGRIAHAVCYVGQEKAYLDFSNRDVFFTLARSGPTIREIATKVAKSLEANWTSASEFTYTYPNNRKDMTATVVKTDPPETDSIPGESHPSKLHVD